MTNGGEASRLAAQHAVRDLPGTGLTRADLDAELTGPAGPARPAPDVNRRSGARAASRASAGDRRPGYDVSQ